MRGRRLTLAFLLAGLGVLIGAAASPAASLQPIGSYTSPVFVTSDPTSENRIYVVEQRGRIQLTTASGTTEFLDIEALVLAPGDIGAGNEQGLLSMAFAADFATSGRFYVFYTETSAGDLRVAELTASGDSADPSTLRNVITIPHTGAAQNHNAGQLQFGPDGNLYVSTGDGGGGGGPSQDPNDLLGKILRIAPTPGGGYGVPADNPFVSFPGVRPEIWSAGLRNPWRFSFDRATGDMLIADVGQGAWEEVDLSPEPVAGRGLDFGWPCREGPVVGTGCAGSFTDPTFYYANDASTCAITGGYVVRDPGLTELQGRYVYADLCVGTVRSHDPADPFATDRSEGLSAPLTTTFGEDVCGRVYVASRNGPVSLIVDATPTDCPPVPAPSGPGADVSGPALQLDAKHKQNVADRKLSVEVLPTEPASVEVGAVIVKGKKDAELFELSPQVTEASPEGTKLSFKLRRGEARRVRRLIADGRRVEVAFSGAATDAAGNRGPDAELVVRLVLN